MNSPFSRSFRNLSLLFLLGSTAAPAFAAADLWIRDDVNDVGNEPNNQSTIFYLSDDIWIRRTPDPNYDPHPFPSSSPTWVPQPHEGPCYRDPKTSSPNYMYVRIRNRGNAPSSGNETLHVYWAKAATGLAWPGDWNDHLDNPCGGTPRLYGYEITKPRKNAATASASEKAAYVAAIQAADAAPYLFPDLVSYFDKQNAIHLTVFMGGLASAHGTLRFLPWHREMMGRYENLLRESNPILTLLYWDWTSDPSPSIIGGAGYMGVSSGVVGAPFTGWGISRSKPAITPAAYAGGLSLAHQTGTILPLADFDDFSNTLEGDAHNNAHCYIGGTVCSQNSPRDPMFFMIHANADRLWAMWQRNNVNRWTPSQAYVPAMADVAITSDLNPWAGAGSISPWQNQIPGDPNGYLIHKTPLHHSVIAPPTYDDVPLRIPVLNTGECVIIEIPFYPPPLVECGGFSDPQHLCLLARIQPVAVAEGANLWQNVKNNNNIAWRNVTLSDCSVGPFFAFAPWRIGAAGELIRNLREDPARLTLQFAEAGGAFRSLFGYGPVRLRLDEALYKAWELGGRKGTGIEPIGANEILVVRSGATLTDIMMDKREVGRMDLALELNRNYQHPFGDIYHLDVLQYDDQGGEEPVGGQRYELDFNLLPIFRKGSDWKYLDGGRTPPQGWTEITFDDRDWTMGTALFGYERPDAVTVLQASPTGAPPTAYFRHSFRVTDPSFFRSLALNLILDDGLVIYLNGKEALRLNMPTGAINPATPAITPITGAAARACRTFRLPPTLLQTGENVLAAELHPAREGNIIDLGFDLELAANEPEEPYQPPAVVIVSPRDGALFRLGTDIPLLAEAFDPDDDLVEIRLYLDGRLISRHTSSPISELFRQLTLGSHRISVEAEDEFRHVTRTEAVFTMVPNLVPQVTLISPVPDTIPFDTPVPLSAMAFDPDGTIGRVEFFVRSHSRFDSPRTRVGVDQTTPYSVQVRGLEPGHYMAFAEATDNQGAVGYSLAGHFIVSPPPGSPDIRIRFDNLGGARVVTLNWEQHGAILEQARNITGPWQTIADAVSPHPIDPAAVTEYYRLRLMPGHQH